MESQNQDEQNLESLPQKDDSITQNDTKKQNNHKKNIIILVSSIGVLLLISIISACIILSQNTPNQNPTEGQTSEEEPAIDQEAMSIEGNGLNDFDLVFLKLENNGNANIVYSPLSIKYALTMLNDGADSETKEQISKVLGTYQVKSYQNSNNLSLANAFFINNSRKDNILESYETSLGKYNAEVIYDDFSTPDNINQWVGKKTFGLVNDLIQEVDKENDSFVLANALAIDMEWKNRIQPTQEDKENGSKYIINDNAYDAYNVTFAHEKTDGADVSFYHEGADFVNYAAVANRYDIVKELGEEKIRATVQEAYEKWADGMKDDRECTAELIAKNAPDLDEYVNTLSKHYGHLSSSTDFYFYDGDDAVAFAKDLKEYDGVSLQYVAIYPKNEDIASYTKNVSADNLNNIIDNLKNAEDWESFDDGYVTTIRGYSNVYNFDYELQLIEDLKQLGIEEVFEESADLGKISSDKPLYVTAAKHKANIAFSNNGIKAAAVTAFGGGRGNAVGCQFVYRFDVPEKKISINEDQYLFIIRDKVSGEAWFAGLVNEG